MSSRRYGVIIPACDEAEALPETVAELRAALPSDRYLICVGVNGSRDGTAEVAHGLQVEVAETTERGYGHGCHVAIEHLRAVEPDVAAYLFVAADGAGNPADMLRLAEVFESGVDLVLGCRTIRWANLRAMGAARFLANVLLGGWCGVLTARFFADLGPLRMVDARLFERSAQREWTYGWTIEGQIAAARLGARIREIPVEERTRRRGMQKVSGVSWQRTLEIGRHIFRAGWRTRRRWSDSAVRAARD